MLYPQLTQFSVYFDIFGNHETEHKSRHFIYFFAKIIYEFLWQIQVSDCMGGVSTHVGHALYTFKTLIKFPRFCKI